MVQETLMIITLVSIWLSLFMSIFTLGGATDFWLKHSTKVIKITPPGPLSNGHDRCSCP